MEGMQREDLERMLFFEEAKKQAEADVKKDPANGQALTRWGGSLLELAHFRQGAEAYEMIEQAVEKFQAALKLNPKKHDALWCLGNAFTSQGFLNTDSARAQSFFDQAADCFRKALAEEPTNDVYKKALDMTSKAPQLHAELQKQLQTQQIVQQAQGGGGQGAAAGAKKEAGGSDFWYDVGGWAIFVSLVIGMFSMAKPAAPATQ
mmetsp:Transcript_14878/g.38165  ORF Transcript_14878/g.38165 Transcript_14878/m.38165 type:complete len:205 (-) Transcript_14878:41-655(-)